jgi:hypothetical protein
MPVRGVNISSAEQDEGDTTTASLIATMMLLMRADFFVPRISMTVRMPTIRAAGTLMMPETVLPSGSLMTVPGADAYAAGTSTPKLWSRLTI